MPKFDGTGPCGNGPRSGRGLGPCREKNLLEEPRGMGKGNGRGIGHGRNFRGTNTNCSEIELLKERIQELEKQLILTKEKLAKGE